MAFSVSLLEASRAFLHSIMGAPDTDRNSLSAAKLQVCTVAWNEEDRGSNMRGRSAHDDGDEEQDGSLAVAAMARRIIS